MTNYFKRFKMYLRRSKLKHDESLSISGSGRPLLAIDGFESLNNTMSTI